MHDRRRAFLRLAVAARVLRLGVQCGPRQRPRQGRARGGVGRGKRVEGRGGGWDREREPGPGEGHGEGRGRRGRCRGAHSSRRPHPPAHAHSLQIWAKIPEGIDVLITHGPPLGRGDLTSHGMRVGCVDLVRASRLRPAPRPGPGLAPRRAQSEERSALSLNSCGMSSSASGPRSTSLGTSMRATACRATASRPT